MKEEETNVGYQNIPDLLSILCNSNEDDNDHSNYCSLLRAQPMPTTDFTAFNPPVVPVRWALLSHFKEEETDITHTVNAEPAD